MSYILIVLLIPRFFVLAGLTPRLNTTNCITMGNIMLEINVSILCMTWWLMGLLLFTWKQMQHLILNWWIVSIITRRVLTWHLTSWNEEPWSARVAEELMSPWQQIHFFRRNKKVQKSWSYKPKIRPMQNLLLVKGLFLKYWIMINPILLKYIHSRAWIGVNSVEISCGDSQPKESNVKVFIFVCKSYSFQDKILNTNGFTRKYS